MRRVMPITLAAVAAAVVSGAPAAAALRATAATTYGLSATLAAGREVPAPKGKLAGATGAFTAKLTLKGKTGTLAWQLALAGLSGQATAARIQLGMPGQKGPVAIPLCTPCRAGAHGSFSGRIGGREKLLQALVHGGAYVNVLTKKNPAGEIRGQLGNWLSYVEATRTVTLRLVAGLDGANSGLNFNGYAKGALGISVPKGWQVTVDCSNQAATRHSCAIVADGTTSKPAFSGAATTSAKAGLAKGKQESFTFTAGRTGTFRIASLAGHESAGIWDRFEVTQKSTPTVTVGPANAVVVMTRTVPGLGQVLVNGSGLTLYMFVPDKQKQVTCTSSCAVVWPPLKLPANKSPLALAAAKGKLLGSDPDPEGGRVVTYHGWPLYSYVADKAPGDATGQALNLNGGLWYVLAPSGKLIHTKPGTAGRGGYGSNSG